MRKDYCIKIGIAILTACLSTVPQTVSATSSKLQDAKDKKEQTKDKIEDAKEELDALNGERAGAQQYVDKLNVQLQNASVELAEMENLIEEKEKGILEAEHDLEEAKKSQVEQYNAMKSRIKFMYESGENTYMNLLFTSTSVSEFLNKHEYFTKLTEYDRDMLKQYTQLQEKIRRSESDLKDSRTALEGLKKEITAKSADVAAMVKEAGEHLKDYLDQIKEQEEKMLAYEKELDDANNDITKLEAQLAYERQLANSSVMRDLSSVTINAGDIDLMAAIIECEAGGESYTGKVAVGAVVMNRVKSSSFPNSILEVIYQKRQFSPVGSGRFAVVLARGANETCYQAATDAMSGVTPVGDRLFFRTPIPGLNGMRIGGHVFY